MNKCNYIYAHSIKPYEILKVQNALVKWVFSHLYPTELDRPCYAITERFYLWHERYFQIQRH